MTRKMFELVTATIRFDDKRSRSRRLQQNRLAAIWPVVVQSRGGRLHQRAPGTVEGAMLVLAVLAEETRALWHQDVGRL